MKKRKIKEMSPEAISLVATRFKVMSEPIRLQILQTLQSGRIAVSEVAQAVSTTQPNVSRHLKILQDAGLVARKQEGNTVYYSIADESVFELCELVCGSLQEKLAEQHAVFS